MESETIVLSACNSSAGSARKNAFTQRGAKVESRKERDVEGPLWKAKLLSSLRVIPPRALREKMLSRKGAQKVESRKERDVEGPLWKAKLLSSLRVIPPRALREKCFHCEKSLFSHRIENRPRRRCIIAESSHLQIQQVQSICDSIIHKHHLRNCGLHAWLLRVIPKGMMRQ